MGRAWRAEYNPVTDISLSVGSLLYYTLLSGIRGLVAYLLSLGFTLVVGYAAAKNKQAEKIIIPAIIFFRASPRSCSARTANDLGRPFSAYEHGTGACGDSLDFHRPGLEHDLQLLFVASSRCLRDLQ